MWHWDGGDPTGMDFGESFSEGLSIGDLMCFVTLRFLSFETEMQGVKLGLEFLAHHLLLCLQGLTLDFCGYLFSFFSPLSMPSGQILQCDCYVWVCLHPCKTCSIFLSVL